MTLTRASVNIGTTPPPPTGGSLVLPDGQGWSRSANSWYEGYQFFADGTVYDLDRGYSSSYGDNWRIERTGTYTTSGNTVDITWSSGSTISWSYSFSGNTLTLGGYAYTVATDVNPVNSPASSKSRADKSVFNKKARTDPKLAGRFAKK